MKVVMQLASRDQIEIHFVQGRAARAILLPRLVLIWDASEHGESSQVTDRSGTCSTED